MGEGGRLQFTQGKHAPARADRRKSLGCCGTTRGALRCQGRGRVSSGAPGDKDEETQRELRRIQTRMADRTPPGRDGAPRVPATRLVTGPRTQLLVLFLLWSVSCAQERNGGLHTGAVPELVRALEDSDGQRRLSAARALTRMGPAAKDATQPLIRALGDKDDRVREQVVRALGAIGPVAEAAVPALLEALENRRFGKRSRRVRIGHGEDHRCASGKRA